MVFNNKTRIICNSGNNYGDAMVPFPSYSGMYGVRYPSFPSLHMAPQLPTPLMIQQAPTIMPQQQVIMQQPQMVVPYQAPMLMPPAMPYSNYAPYSNFAPSSNWNQPSNFSPNTNTFAPNNQNWNYNGGNSNSQCNHPPVNVYFTTQPREYEWPPPEIFRRRRGRPTQGYYDDDDLRYPTPTPWTPTSWGNTWDPLSLMNPWGNGWGSGGYYDPIWGWTR